LNKSCSGWRTSFDRQPTGRAHETVLSLGAQDEILTRDPQTYGNVMAMQLLRDNCHIHANIFVILVAASSSAKVNTKHGVGVLSKIVACARMHFSSVRKRRSARTVFRPRRFCQNLRAARANPVF